LIPKWRKDIRRLAQMKLILITSWKKLIGKLFKMKKELDIIDEEMDIKYWGNDKEKWQEVQRIKKLNHFESFTIVDKL
jgi:hypothetical protein